MLSLLLTDAVYRFAGKVTHSQLKGRLYLKPNIVRFFIIAHFMLQGGLAVAEEEEGHKVGAAAVWVLRQPYGLKRAAPSGSEEALKKASQERPLHLVHLARSSLSRSASWPDGLRPARVPAEAGWMRKGRRCSMVLW